VFYRHLQNAAFTSYPPVEGEEFERVAAEHPLPLPALFLMEFPSPRDILRLDPAV
jgi:hypothetical protein